MIKFSIPAKHFILGEYAVLDRGPALLFMHEPRFMLIASQGIPQLTGIHSKSPAGRFYQENFSLFESHQLSFIDPYQNIGGLGASSAQFILMYALYQHLLNQPFSLETLFQAYQSFAYSGIGYPPSGSDIVAQTVGGLLAWIAEKKEVTQFNWPFETSLSFHFVHTGHKVKTHEHLQTLQLGFSLETFKKIVHTSLQALQDKDPIIFCDTINDYAHHLDKHNLTTKNTRALLNTLLCLPGVKAAKGCGALGNDVLFILTEKENETAFKKWISNNNLRYLSNQNNISPGLLLEPETETTKEI